MGEIKQYAQRLLGQVTDFTNEVNTKDTFTFAENIRFNTGYDNINSGITFEKGTKLEVKLPTITSVQGTGGYSIKYGNKFLRYTHKEGNSNTELFNLFYNGTNISKVSGKQLIIEGITIDEGFVLFSTDGNGFDCIWVYKIASKELILKYVRNMGFSLERPIKALYNYENTKIKKVYWIDGISQLRFINLETKVANGDYEELIDLKLENINQVGLFDVYQPEVEVLNNGGNHTAGTIQYAYNLYKINGNQTKLSPLSEMISLGNGTVNGGRINDKVSDLPKVTIEKIDKNYTNIRLYAIKYTSFNELPEVYIVLDRQISSYDQFTFYDTGLLKVQDMSIEQLLFIGSDPIYPKIIESKDNHLFLANYSESKYKLKNFNSRLYSFKENSNITRYYDKFKVELDDEGQVIGVLPADNSETSTVSKSNVAVNIGDDMVAVDIEDNLYTTTPGEFGMEGKFFKLIMYRTDKRTVPYLNNVLKDNEIYRFSVKLYNGYGQYTDPLYLGDYYTMPAEDLGPTVKKSNLNGFPLVVSLSLKSDFKEYLDNKNNFLDINGKYDSKLKPVGFKLMRGIRNSEDRLVVVQGIINPMISSNPYKNVYNASEVDINKAYEEGFKMPWFLRTNSELIYPMQKYNNKQLINDNYSNANGLADRGQEVFSSVTTDNKRTAHFQFTKMMQLFAPELTFNQLNSIDSNQFRFKGLLSSKENSVYAAEVATDSLNKDTVIKVFHRISARANASTPHLEHKDTIVLNGDGIDMFDYGLVGPTGADSAHSVQFYRDYTGELEYSQSNKLFSTLGKPVLVERGQGETSYNGIPEYTFTNKFNRFRTDTPKTGSGSTSDPKGKAAITKFNSFNERNITFVEKQGSPLEDILADLGIPVGDVVNPSIPLVEFVRNISYYYLNNMYGGNNIAGKLSTQYMEIGPYAKIQYDGINLMNTPCITDTPGDVFVGDFEFEKISLNDAAYTTDSYNAIEIVKFKLETTIDLNRRSDLSRYNWDGFFMPEYEDYHNYNRVYSQQSNLFTNVNDNYNYKGTTEFSNRIIATRKKNSGELIDSWTDIMVNNFIDLDGKYGPLTSILSYGQGLVTFQKQAVGVVAVNPRTQTITTDGNEIELGRGDVLHDYKYISTYNGSSHPWAIQNTKSGIYFYDDFNRSLCSYNGEGLLDLGKLKNNLSFIKKTLGTNEYSTNPLLNKGISIGYNKELGDIMLTINNNKAITYNESTASFTGLLPYTSSKVLNYGEDSYSVDPLNKDTIHIHTKGKYNEYYGLKKPSKLEFLLNPEPLNDCVFNNLSFKSEAYKEGTLVNMNWDTIRLNNEYQDSGVVKLVERVNTRKLNRMTNITLPREKGTRNRIRNNWSLLGLESTNSNSLLFRNNSFIISYMVVDRIIK